MNKKNILIIGSGGREHALATFLSKNKTIDKIYTAPGNAGTPGNISYNAGNTKDFETLADFAQAKEISLTVVGPEIPLCNGIVDVFDARGLSIFGPSQKAAFVTEGDKASARNFMRNYGIPQPDFEVFNNLILAKDYLHSLPEQRIVVKASGLAAGKGVYVCENLDEAVKAAEEIMGQRIFGSSGNKIVIEDCMDGEEASILAVCDGQRAVYLASSQDHKRVFDGDKGLNTGGMGAYAPAPVVIDELLKNVDDNIVKKTLEGMADEGMPYKGCLYVGLMIKDGEPKVVEYNCRFGDPEIQAVLALLKTDLYELLKASADGNLDQIQVENYDKAACCVVLASEGYPGKYETGKIISGLDKADKMDNTYVFHAGTEKEGSGKTITAGGRVINVVGIGNTIKDAIKTAYKGTEAIDFDNKYLRNDIGYRALKKR